ncbi:MAG: oxidoreductase [Sphingomonadales bacterium]|nr:oxidoreductase [Sphingomonadales bacterium]MDE2568355.1 oxidoreductase [Sphingomonadales bacterium]
MTSPPPVRAGLIGFGYAGRTFHAPLVQATEGLELSAVVSSDAAKVHAVMPEIEVLPTPEALLARGDIDLVIIATPNDSHAPLAHAAIAAGKAVVVDKPFALSLDEARGVIAAAEAADVLLAVFHNRRWDGDFLGVADAIAKGRIGRVTHFESHFDRFRPLVRDRWREGRGPGAGVWFDLAPHLVDQALCLFGLPDTVSADLAALRDGGLTDDWAHAVLAWSDKRALLHASMLVAGGSARFIVHGTGGSLVRQALDPQEAQLVEGMEPGAPGWGLDEDPLVLETPEGRVHEAAPVGDQRRFYAGVREALRGLAPNPVPPVEALAVMAVIEAGIASAREGRAMPLALSEAERVAYAGSRR